MKGNILERAEVYIKEEEGLLVGFNKHRSKFSIPGGKLEVGESPKEAVIRETLEEIGVKLRDVKPFAHQPFYIVDLDALRVEGCRIDKRYRKFNKIVTYVFLASFKGMDFSLYDASKEKRKARIVAKEEVERYYRNRNRSKALKAQDKYKLQVLSYL